MTTAEAVRGYWDSSPCGSTLVAAPEGSPEFFATIEQIRYEREPCVLEFAGFDQWQDRDVLEIGVGLGTDFIQFARAGAKLVGVDLSPRSLELTRTRLAQEGLAAELHATNAEQLPLPEASFDLVYSWGVIHHAPHPENVIAEIHRVLRPGGQVRAMLYNRRSLCAVDLWARQLIRGRFASVRSVLADCLESPGTKAYTERELREMFSAFRDVNVKRWRTIYDQRLAGPLATNRYGWFLTVEATR